MARYGNDNPVLLPIPRFITATLPSQEYLHISDPYGLSEKGWIDRFDVRILLANPRAPVSYWLVKRGPLVITLLVFSYSLYGQGTLEFNNYVPNNHVSPFVDAPVYRFDGTGMGAGFTAQLYLVTGTSITPLLPTTTFHTENPAAAFYVIDPGPVAVPGTSPGQVVEVRMVVYDGPNYDVSVCRGQSNDLQVTLGGGAAPPSLLTGLLSFRGVGPLEVPAACVPEPSGTALSLLAFGLLFARPRLLARKYSDRLK